MLKPSTILVWYIKPKENMRMPSSSSAELSMLIRNMLREKELLTVHMHSTTWVWSIKLKIDTKKHLKALTKL
jgi:hypothetical protein